MLELIDGRNQMTPVHIPRPRVAAGERDPAVVASIVEDVRLRGDAALLEHTERRERVRLPAEELRIPSEEIEAARGLVRPELIDALEVMRERLRASCERQSPSSWMDRRSDETVGELVRPLRRVGVLAGGGRAAYASNVVAAAVPAAVAGVQTVAVALPPGAPSVAAEAVLAACAVCGVDEVYRMAGAQAVAALAYGTESVRPVEKIVGPGDVRVTQAKRLVAGWVGTDDDAGVGELALVAGEGADPRRLAADLVAHAELGRHGVHALITWVPELVDATSHALDLELAAHPRFDDVENALIEGGRAVLVRDVDHALDTVNGLAPATVELAFDGAANALDRLHNTGAVFIGSQTPPAVGRFAAGINPVLPGGGGARWSSGLSVHDFVKRIYVCDLSSEALDRLAPHAGALAEAEGLSGHERAVRARTGEPWERDIP